MRHCPDSGVPTDERQRTLKSDPAEIDLRRDQDPPRSEPRHSRRGSFFAPIEGERFPADRQWQASDVSLRSLATAALLFTALLFPGAARGQTQPEWNGERASGLVEQARDLRQATAVDSAFQAYQADARGYVYFFLDRLDSDERTLVKTDQVALEVFWRAPRQRTQRLVGRRDAKELPTNINYHLDHLTVVQDDFGDLIRLGDGDEVEAVVHPVAPGAKSIYDYRLTDSLTVTIPSPVRTIRVYEIEIRPKGPEAPGVIGSLFLERGTGAIVRLNFTFTPASYVDRRLDYIRISMDNSLWEGKYWLPYRQEVELRRELPIISFLGGSVIRARFEIRDYRFNPTLQPGLFLGGRVSAVPLAERAAFVFESGLYDQLANQGLDPSPDIEAIRDQATSVMRQRSLSGLNGSRLHVPFVSSVYRYNRAEGSFLGAGMSLPLGPRWRLLSRGGYALGRENGQIAVDVRSGTASQGLSMALRWNELRDAGGRHPGASRTVNSLEGLLTSSDYTDPYFTTGLGVRYRWASGTTRSLEIGAEWERHGSGTSVVDDGLGGNPTTVPGIYRPVLAINEGDDRAVEASYRTRTLARGFESSATARVGQMEDQPYASFWWATTLRRDLPERGATLEAGLHFGLSTEDAPVQTLFLLGGRHTLPGYPYRSFIGNQMALARVEASQAVLAPWLTYRVFGAAGITGFGRNGLPDPGWLRRSTSGVKSSAGVGLDLGWDLLHFELGRGLNDGGDWEFVFSVQRRFWEWL